MAETVTPTVTPTKATPDDSHIHARSFDWPTHVKTTEPVPAPEPKADETAESTPEEPKTPVVTEGDEKPEPKAAKSKPAKKDPEKRIAEAHYQRRKAEERAAAEQARAEQLERELVAAKAPPVPQVQEPTPQATAVPETFATWEAWAAQPEHNGQTYEDYMDARADWRALKRGLLTREDAERIADQKATEKLAAKEEAERHAAFAKADDDRRLAFMTGQEKAKTKYDDYAEVVEASDLPTNPTMDQYLVRSGDRAGELLYYLGSHPEDCRRIAALRTPAEVIEEMALLKSQLAGAPSGPSASLAPVTKAPPPPQPVGGASGASQVNLATANMVDYSRVRAAQRRALAERM